MYKALCTLVLRSPCEATHDVTEFIIQVPNFQYKIKTATCATILGVARHIRTKC